MPFRVPLIACECWARDGLQSIPTVVATDLKVEMINRTVRAGFRKVEVTSFSHPTLSRNLRTPWRCSAESIA